jgi:hypothetical protein
METERPPSPGAGETEVIVIRNCFSGDGPEGYKFISDPLPDRPKSNTSGTAGGLKYVNRSKRLKTMGHLKGGGNLSKEI